MRGSIFNIFQESVLLDALEGPKNIFLGYLETPNTLRDLSFFSCVCVWGGEVNFEGEQKKKADLIKGGIKFGRNMVQILC